MPRRPIISPKDNCTRSKARLMRRAKPIIQQCGFVLIGPLGICRARQVAAVMRRGCEAPAKRRSAPGNRRGRIVGREIARLSARTEDGELAVPAGHRHPDPELNVTPGIPDDLAVARQIGSSGNDLRGYDFGWRILNLREIRLYQGLASLACESA